MYGGFVQWTMGHKDDGKDSVAQQVEPESHWPELRVLVLVVGLLVFEKHTERKSKEAHINLLSVYISM